MREVASNHRGEKSGDDQDMDEVEEKLGILVDNYAKRILVACYYKPKPVQRLSWMYDIPIAAAYRKVHELEGAGFLKVAKKERSRRGKRVKLYKTTLREAVIRFKDGKFQIEFEYPNREKEKIQLTFDQE